MRQITGLEKLCLHFTVEEKTHRSGCVLLLPEGPVKGVLLLSAGQAPQELFPPPPLATACCRVNLKRPLACV